ncbi:helix-turn-helix domain-containing protein [Priestia koreensis]|uniref:helix-turn-helix domain-containing protein n=1 Tax=Priestia koreensis TaxID=284581 RepID=UPI00345AD55A
MMLMNVIAKNVRRGRKRRGLSQDELALKLNTSRSKITKWETDKQLPSIEDIMMICDLFDSSIDSFVGYKGCKSSRKSILKDANHFYGATSLFEHEVKELRELMEQYPAFHQLIQLLISLPSTQQETFIPSLCEFIKHTASLKSN